MKTMTTWTWATALAIALAVAGCDDGGDGGNGECIVPSGVYTATWTYAGGTCPPEYRDAMDGFRSDFPVGEGGTCGTYPVNESQNDGTCTITTTGSVTATSAGMIGGTVSFNISCNNGFSCVDSYNLRF